MINWEMVGVIAEALGALGAIIGLLFVYRELKFVRRNQYAATTQQIMDSQRELWALVLDNPDLAPLMADHVGLDAEFRNKHKLSPKTSLQLLLFLWQYENIFYQHRNDMLPPSLWKHWVNSMRHTFSNEIAKEAFQRTKLGYSEDFKEELKNEIGLSD